MRSGPNFESAIKRSIHLPMKELLKTNRNDFGSSGLTDAFIQNYRAGIARPVVLLADGNREARETLGQGLRQCGFVVREVGTAAEVEEVAALVMPDVILLDVRFPDGEGADIIRELMGNPTTAPIPVIILQSPVLGRCRQECLEAGAETVVNKPVCVDDVSAAVRSHLAKRDAAKLDF